MSVSPSGTPKLTQDAIDQFHDAGLTAISLSIDGSTAQRHDAIRGVPGVLGVRTPHGPLSLDRPA